MAALAASLLDEMDLAQLHALIDGLTHIVDGEQGGGNARQGLHLHAGDARRLDGAERLHSLPLGQKPEVHAHFRQRQRMTQRDELAGALGGHDAGNAGHAQYIAFFHGAALVKADRFEPGDFRMFVEKAGQAVGTVAGDHRLDFAAGEVLFEIEQRTVAGFEVEVNLEIQVAFRRLPLELVQKLRVKRTLVQERILAERKSDHVDPLAGAHERAAPRHPFDQLPLHQMLQALVDRDRRDMVEFRQFQRRGQPRAVGQFARNDPLRQMVGDLQLQRAAGHGFKRGHETAPLII